MVIKRGTNLDHCVYCDWRSGARNTEGCFYLRLEGSIDALMSLRESVKDLNSNEFRSPPSARHCNKWDKIIYWIGYQSTSSSFKHFSVYMQIFKRKFTIDVWTNSSCCRNCANLWTWKQQHCMHLFRSWAGIKAASSWTFIYPLPLSVAAGPWVGRWDVWGWGWSHSAVRPWSSCSAAPSAGPLLHNAAAALWGGQLEPCPDLEQAGRTHWVIHILVNALFILFFFMMVKTEKEMSC